MMDAVAVPVKQGPTRGLKLVVNPGRFHDAVRRMSGSAILVDRHGVGPIGPHLVSAFAGSQKLPAEYLELLLYFLFVPIHACAA